MSSVSSLPVSASTALPDLPARAWRRILEVLDEQQGFVDRVQWAADTVQTLYIWRHQECISAAQHVALLRELRARLQVDLGAITMEDAGMSAALLP